MNGYPAPQPGPLLPQVEVDPTKFCINTICATSVFVVASLPCCWRCSSKRPRLSPQPNINIWFNMCHNMTSINVQGGPQFHEQVTTTAAIYLFSPFSGS